jgi:hypothetical protein
MRIIGKTYKKRPGLNRGVISCSGDRTGQCIQQAILSPAAAVPFAHGDCT